ncbi:uncharacterized protein LOC118182405 [Stegodyphus dumicola]|uniref:uncharacterized protein LOC118182405 n=1 Tax=Stegodyphus dumicola TaxID=202533 RepID=UPI0015A94A1E|nr:uncharacterized protein LOC118182405 [Stegodyphus dumicola]
MICQNKNNLISTYGKHYKAPDCITVPHLLEKDVDFSRPVQPLTVPYSSKSWKTSYNLDYGLKPEVKSVRKCSFPEIPSMIEYSDPLYKSEWTTSYEDYGQKRDFAINTVPLTEQIEKSEASNMVLLPNTEVGRLLKY